MSDVQVSLGTQNGDVQFRALYRYGDLEHLDSFDGTSAYQREQSIKRVLLKFGLKQGDGEDLDSQLQELVKGYLQSKASGKRSRQRTAGPIEIYQEMPVDVFPPKVRTFIETVSDAIGCNPAFPAMPLLSALASCIGNSRRVRLKSSWAEPATVWALIIAESGQHKSPAMKHVLWPLHEWQDQAFRQYAADQAAYEEELEAYQEASKGRKNNGPKPPKPTPPVCAVFRRRHNDGGPDRDPRFPLAWSAGSYRRRNPMVRILWTIQRWSWGRRSGTGSAWQTRDRSPSTEKPA